MELFGSEITRAIWGSAENVLLIYVGSAADFALNPENHWLFFTMRLPNNPQKRFVETFRINRQIFMTSKDKVPELMMKIRNVHTGVEKSRELKEEKPSQITNRAYLEVGDMLIEYGIRGYEYLNRRKLTAEECDTYFADMVAMFKLMRIEVSDVDYQSFLIRRKSSIERDLQVNEFTPKLYEAYLKDLGYFRYYLLRQFQSYFVATEICKKLGLTRNPLFGGLYRFYPLVHSPRLFNLMMLVLAKPEVRKILKAS